MGENIKKTISKAISHIAYTRSSILDIIVFFSSLYFLFWLLLTIYIGDVNLQTLREISDVFHWLFVIFIFFAFYFLSTENRYERIGKLGRVISILGSLLVLFIFINSYLNISNSLNEKFSIIWEKIEVTLNNFVTVILFIAIAIFVSFYFILLPLVQFIGEKLKVRARSALALVLSFIFIFSFFSFQALSVKVLLWIYNHSFFNFLIYLLGFSLFSIHFFYLIREVKRISKSENPEKAEH